MKNECINVLIACECSQVEVKAFRQLGFAAYSCDLQASYGGNPDRRGQKRGESLTGVDMAMTCQWGGLVRSVMERRVPYV